MDINNLTESTSKVYDAFVAVQMDGDKIMFIREWSKSGITNDNVTLTDDINKTIFYYNEEWALSQIRYLKRECATGLYHEASDLIDFDKLFLMRMKETTIVKHELSEFKNKKEIINNEN